MQVAEPETDACREADYHVYGHSTLVKENREAQLELDDTVFCEPEKI